MKLDALWKSRRIVRVQSGALVLYADEICDAGTCTRPPNHPGRHSQFDGPEYDDCVKFHLPDPDPVEVLQSKLDAAEGWKAPAEGWKWFGGSWRKEIDDDTMVEIRAGFFYNNYHEERAEIVWHRPYARFMVADDSKCPSDIICDTVYDCILAVEAWIKERA